MEGFPQVEELLIDIDPFKKEQEYEAKFSLRRQKEVLKGKELEKHKVQINF